ncbi:MAG TPA: transaldolase family protein [Roseiflexaceae bacterium]|nr:transaldolase family protein [Roseiflexaceae bacterium]
MTTATTASDAAEATTANGPLHEMTLTTPTMYWNDSCSVEELSYAIERGANGATSNPVIVLNVLKKEMHLWRDRILEVIDSNPTWTETEVSWQVYKELALNGARLLMPVFERQGKKWGRLSIQTDPALYRNRDALLEQTTYFGGLAPNMQVKMPATSAGIAMIEEATYRGVNLNVTVSFSVPQVLAAGDAIERGLKRRDTEGLDTALMSPVVTMMVGRNDDWMKVVAKRDGIDIDPEYLEWSGVACFKNAYRIYGERGYRAKLLAAAYRNFLHWTEFVGGDVVLTMPWEWQVKYNQSDVRPVPRMHIPVDQKIVDTLYERIPDFRRSYEPDGMTVEEFDSYGPTVRTLRSFIEGWHTFVGVIRDLMLPNPDMK